MHGRQRVYCCIVSNGLEYCSDLKASADLTFQGILSWRTLSSFTLFFLSGTQTSLSPRTPSSSTPSPIALKKWHGHATTRRISSTCTLAWSPGSKSTTVPTRYSHLLLNALSVEHWVLKTDNSPPGLKCTGIGQKARLSQLCSGFHKVLFTLCICNYSDNIQYPAQVTCSCINIPTTDQSDHICPCQHLL